VSDRVIQRPPPAARDEHQRDRFCSETGYL
jgi:hypothetical protein